MAASDEILMIPLLGQGHLFPFSELAHHFAARGFRYTIIVPSDLAPSLSTSCSDEPLISVSSISLPPSPDGSPLPIPAKLRLMNEPLSALLAEKASSPNPPICILLDFNLGRMIDSCRSSGMPIVAFSTSAGFSAAVDYVKSTLPTSGQNPNDFVKVPGFPSGDELQLTYADLTPRSYMVMAPGQGPPGPATPGGPPATLPSRFIPWLSNQDVAQAFLFNTCDHLERPFLDYMAKEMRKPFIGVGPLLPRKFWESSIAQDGSIRSTRESGLSESDLETWLDSKPHGTVIYAAFGTEVSPNPSELAELASALEESSQPFIWVVPIQAGSSEPADWQSEFEERVRGRGLVIRGWAPQLLILSHVAVGAFLTHCGWNSVMESLARGVPLLAWPIRGDQHSNAKLVSSHLKVGVMVRPEGEDREVRKDDVVDAIKRLQADEGIKQHVGVVREFFAQGFPGSSVASLDSFRDFVSSELKCGSGQPA